MVIILQQQTHAHTHIRTSSHSEPCQWYCLNHCSWTRGGPEIGQFIAVCSVSLLHVWALSTYLQSDNSTGTWISSRTCWIVSHFVSDQLHGRARIYSKLKHSILCAFSTCECVRRHQCFSFVWSCTLIFIRKFPPVFACLMKRTYCYLLLSPRPNQIVRKDREIPGSMIGVPISAKAAWALPYLCRACIVHNSSDVTCGQFPWYVLYKSYACDAYW